MFVSSCVVVVVVVVERTIKDEQVDGFVLFCLYMTWHDMAVRGGSVVYNRARRRGNQYNNSLFPSPLVLNSALRNGQDEGIIWYCIECIECIGVHSIVISICYFPVFFYPSGRDRRYTQSLAFFCNNAIRWLCGWLRFAVQTTTNEYGRVEQQQQDETKKMPLKKVNWLYSISTR